MNKYVVFPESRLFDNTVKPDVCFRYVDDTFVFFDSEPECDRFHVNLNQLHPALTFYSREGAKQLLEFSRCFGGERRRWIHHHHL